MAYLNFTPNRRWLQFRLRTLLIVMTLTALGMGWWQHRGDCLERAKVHDVLALACLIQGTIDPGGGRWEEDLPPQSVNPARLVEEERLTNLSKRHDETSATLRLAVWLPWLRWSINEPPIEVESEQHPTP